MPELGRQVALREQVPEELDVSLVADRCVCVALASRHMVVSPEQPPYLATILPCGTLIWSP